MKTQSSRIRRLTEEDARMDAECLKVEFNELNANHGCEVVAAVRKQRGEFVGYIKIKEAS